MGDGRLVCTRVHTHTRRRSKGAEHAALSNTETSVAADAADGEGKEQRALEEADGEPTGARERGGSLSGTSFIS